MPSGSRPSTFAFTGSKSTNQDLNTACAILSKVELDHCISSISHLWLKAVRLPSLALLS